MKKITSKAFCTILGLLSIIIVMNSCHFNATYNNDERDKMDAERVTGEFYSLTKSEDYPATYKLFSSKFFKVSDTDKLNNILNATREKLGSVESLKLDRWETQSIQGTEERNDYFLQYAVKRQHFESKETFTLSKENGVIKIIGYNVSSDGFFQPERK